MATVQKSPKSIEMEPNLLPGDGMSLSKPVSSVHIIKATFRKELIIKRRYLVNLIGQVVRTLLFILIFWFFANALEFSDFLDSSKRAVFIFYITGFSLMMLDGVALWSPYSTVQTDLLNGTLETLYVTPSSKYSYFLGSILAEAFISSIFVVPVFIAVIYFAELGSSNLVMYILVLLVSLMVLVVFGVMIAFSAVIWKQVGAIIGVLGSLFTFVSGGLIPVSSFPVGLRYFAYLFPYTWGFDLLRYYAFDGAWETLLPVWLEWTILISMFAAFAMLSLKLVNKASRHAKQNGLHLL